MGSRGAACTGSFAGGGVAVSGSLATAMPRAGSSSTVGSGLAGGGSAGGAHGSGLSAISIRPLPVIRDAGSRELPPAALARPGGVD